MKAEDDTQDDTEDDEQQQVDGDTDGDAGDDDSTLGGGPGFTGVAALVALLASALRLQRRQ